MPSIAAEQEISLIAAINDDGQILLLKRPEDVNCGGLWSFPGGKVKSSETLLAAAKRELDEETGLAGRDWLLVGKHCHDYGEIKLRLNLFACHCDAASELQCQETPMWLAPVKLAGVPMPEANRTLLPMLLKILG